MTDRTLRKLEAFDSFLQSLLRLSACRRNQCSAIIFPPDFSAVHAIGYNGPPSGLMNSSCTEEEGRCGCVHAEANALLKLNARPHSLMVDHVDDVYVDDVYYEGFWMMSSTAPCYHCAGLIINSQVITQVIWRQPYRNDRGRDLLHKANIGEVQFDDFVQEWRQDYSISQ